MSFILNGTTINQSGIDADLSGLIGIAGVATTSLTGDANYNLYLLQDLRTIVDGTLTIDSWKEKLLFNGLGNASIQINSGAHLIIEGAGEAIIDPREGSDFGSGDTTINLIAGGSLTLSNCILSSARGYDLDNTGVGSVRINGTTFKKITADPTQVVRFDFTGDPDAIVDCRLDGIGGLFTGLGDFVGIALLNGGSIDSNNTLISDQSPYGIGNKNLQLFNISFSGNIGFYSLKLRNRNTMTINGFDLPLDQIGITGRLKINDAGIVFFERNLSFKITDGSGNVEGAVVKITDNKEATDTFTTPVTYTFTSIADGTTNQETILLGVGSSTSATTQEDHDVRESYGDDDDMDVRMTANIASYGHNLATTPVGLIGLNDLEVSPAPLGTDFLVTEADKAITDAYTELDTAQKFYDYAKAYLVDNYAGETTTIVTRSGDTIDAGAYDVELRSGGSEVFTFDGTTISVRVGTEFTGNITTTGTVTFAGSATINGSYFDATADSDATIALPTGADVFTLHANFADADAGINPIFSGDSANPTVRYLSSVYGGQELFIRATNSTNANIELIASEIVPVAAGSYTFTVLAFNENAQLTAIQATLSALGTKEQIAQEVWKDESAYTSSQKGGVLKATKQGVDLLKGLV